MKTHFDFSDGAEMGRLTTDLASHIAQARAVLVEKMWRLGLSTDAGWRTAEEVRSSANGTVVFLRPIHGKFVSPDLEVTIEVDRDGRSG
jgi:hypothetical protein